MADPKPSTARAYPAGQAGRVRSASLYLATKLGDLAGECVVVGGLVPSLLIDQEQLDEGQVAHPGTMDLDVALGLALLDGGRYRQISQRLREAGLCPDRTPRGNPTLQRWKMKGEEGILLDFLIPPSRETDRGGTIRHLEGDFGAVITPGLDLAFRDCLTISLSGRTPAGEYAERQILVCGPGAFVVLKALAFQGRGENKDAFDLYYVIRNFGQGPSEISAALEPLLDSPEAAKALEVLRRDFTRIDSLGPMRVASFLGDPADDALRADVVGFVTRVLTRCGAR